MVHPTPLLQILHHSSSRLLINRNMIALDAVDLRPPFSASGLQREINVREGLGDFGGEVGGDGD